MVLIQMCMNCLNNVRAQGSRENCRQLGAADGSALMAVNRRKRPSRHLAYYDADGKEGRIGDQSIYVPSLD